MRLSMYASETDVLTPEFIRTYQHVAFNGTNLLRAEEAVCKEERPEVVKHAILHPQGERETVGFDHQFYGFRPQVTSVWYLNAWEFCMYWEVKRFKKKQGVQDLQGPDELAFPDTPRLQQFRKTWFLHRRHRLRIPTTYRTKLPKARRDSKEEQGRLYSVYLRPWTLLEEAASAHVPFLGHLGRPRLAAQHAQGGEQNPLKTGYWENWLFYLRGQVVSRHQCRIIKQFVGITNLVDFDCEDLPESQTGASRGVQEAHNWTVEQVQRVLQALTATSDESKGKKRKNHQGPTAVEKSLQVGAALWASEQTDWPADLSCEGSLPEDGVRKPIKRQEKARSSSPGQSRSLYLFLLHGSRCRCMVAGCACGGNSAKC